MRPEIDLIIPVQRRTEQLDRAVSLIEKHTKRFRLCIVEEPGLNVSEARQKAMDEVARSRLVCFLDDDSEILHSGWLDAMAKTLAEHPDAGAVFSGEWWGTDRRVEIAPVAGDTQVAYGPAACMLIDRERVKRIQWDRHIGLRSGWLGGDFEEVDYCYRIRRAGMNLYRCTSALFHHTGGRTTLRAFGSTDRQKTVCVMRQLLDLKYHIAPDNDDWFKGLKYVPADPDNDLMLGPGGTLRECYRDVIVRNGLSHIRGFVKLGLT